VSGPFPTGYSILQLSLVSLYSLLLSLPSLSPSVPACCSLRYGLSLVSCYGLFVAYALRVNLSVDMLNTDASCKSTTSVCPAHPSPARPKHNHTVRITTQPCSPQAQPHCAYHHTSPARPKHNHTLRNNVILQPL
jgi:hypothetical protein